MEASFAGSYLPRRRRRPNRTAAERRQQYERAQARVVSHILKTTSALQHRGNLASRELSSLAQALLSSRSRPQHESAWPPSRSELDLRQMRQMLTEIDIRTRYCLQTLEKHIQSVHESFSSLQWQLVSLHTWDAAYHGNVGNVDAGVVPVSTVGVNTDDYDSAQPTLVTDVGVNTDDYDPSISYSRGGPQLQTQSAELDAYVISINAASAASSSGGNENENKNEDISVQNNVCTNCNGTGWISKFSTCSLCANALKP